MIDFGLTPHEFRATCFERRPRLQRAAIDGALFGWSDLDALLFHVEPVAPVLQLFDAGGPVPEERYTRRIVRRGALRVRLDKRRFHELLRAGATLVVNGVDDYSPQAARLCRDVSRFAAAPASGNAYLSVGGSGTFGKHWDTHDVFAIQLIGRKRWQVFEPTLPLPLAMHRSDASGHACPAAPLLECVLEAGDLLYVPRGWWHLAIPLPEPSLHLSVGTYGPTVHDYLLWACARHLPDVPAARRSLTDDVGRDELERVLHALTRAVLAEASRAEFARQLAEREHGPTWVDTELLLAAGADGLDPEALVTLDAPLAAAPDRQAEVVVNGARLRLHPLCCEILSVLREGALTAEALCARLPHERPEAVRAAVLDLARHEIVSIERNARPPRF